MGQTISTVMGPTSASFPPVPKVEGAATSALVGSAATVALLTMVPQTRGSPDRSRPRIAKDAIPELQKPIIPPSFSGSTVVMAPDIRMATKAG